MQWNQNHDLCFFSLHKVSPVSYYKILCSFSPNILFNTVHFNYLIWHVLKFQIIIGSDVTWLVSRFFFPFHSYFGYILTPNQNWDKNQLLGCFSFFMWNIAYDFWGVYWIYNVVLDVQQIGSVIHTYMYIRSLSDSAYDF